ncbi:MAG TPA: hypothetical protein VJT80_23715 [Steroidobacteraceae bacterium]|nr:hypothetical protein [Steroidobacteraceae bacterium]
MSARAEQVPTDSRAVVIARAEHIHIEAEPGTVAAPTAHRQRKVRKSYVLKSRLRGCETEVSILEDHYVSVRTVRPDAQPRKYEFDLRFANPKPVRVRSISWFWLALAGSMIGLAAGGLWATWADASRWSSPIFLTALVTLLASGGALIMFLRRTLESLEFVSMHGGATLLSVVGGIGSARAGKHFFIDLIKSINAAKAARPQERPQFLRDEMREHHRLRELGVMSEQQYEQGKARILAKH